MWEVFSWKGKFRQKLLTAVLNPKPLHILCVREGEDDQGGTGKESFDFLLLHFSLPLVLRH